MAPGRRDDDSEARASRATPVNAGEGLSGNGAACFSAGRRGKLSNRQRATRWRRVVSTHAPRGRRL